MNRFLTAGILVVVAGCSTLDTGREDSPYFREGHYWNLDPNDALYRGGFASFWKRRLFSPREADALPGAPDTPPPVVSITAESLQAPPGFVRITWIGHATTWISINKGTRQISIVTDPMFGGIPVRGRSAPLPLEKEAFPPADIALVSHAHYDHCDTESLQLLTRKNPNIVIFFPEGMSSWANEKGLKDHRHLRWFRKMSVNGLLIHSLPAQHFSNRTLWDWLQYHWGAYLIEIGRTKIYFGGDTGFSMHFQKTAEYIHAPVDAAILPIGAYMPRELMKAAHINPPEAVQAAKILHAKTILPVHWGTFRMTDETFMEPSMYLQREAEKAGQAALYWTPGEHFDLKLAD